VKRARITQSPAANTVRGADVTDRLLGGPSQAKSRAARQSSPTAKRSRAKKSAQSAPASDLPTYTPYRTVEPRPPVTPGPALQTPEPLETPSDTPEALRRALLDTEKALAALVAAAQATPARHDLAVRYRLDALRHHLRQVSEFIASRREA
jgi:hypothetical protein